MIALKRIKRLGREVWAVVRTVDVGTSARWVAGLVASAPEVLRSGRLAAADGAVASRLVRARVPTGQVALLPGSAFGSTRELYCRNVYLRRGLRVVPDTWVVDLGANAGMFTNLAAVAGARILAVEAQPLFASAILELARLNGTADRIKVVTARIGANRHEIGVIGVLADPVAWNEATHTDGTAAVDVGMNELLARFAIDRISLLKIDIEGGEFSLLSGDDDLAWLDRVDQIAMEVHPAFGSVPDLVVQFRRHGLSVDATDSDGNDVFPEHADAAYLYARWR